MKRLSLVGIIVFAFLVMAVATAEAGVPADKATGEIWMEAYGDTFHYAFVVQEAVGVEGESGYRPEKGWVTWWNHPGLPDGTWPCENIVVDGATASFTVVVDGYGGYTDNCADVAEPGAGYDTYDGIVLVHGNIQVQTY